MSGELRDADVLRRLRRDPDAVGVLYDRYMPRLVAALAHVGGDRETAFDLAQETFARLLERGHSIRLAGEDSAWPWLWTVARNLLRDRQRRDAFEVNARRRLGITPSGYDANVIDELIRRVDARELAAALTNGLDELPSEQRDALLGRFVQDRSYASLAFESGTTAAALRARVSRGLRALRLRLAGGRP